MASMGDNQRGATDWLLFIQGAHSRLQEMVEALRSQLGVRPEAVGGAASSGPPYREVMSNMLQIVWELQHLQTEGLMDGQLEALKRCCDDIFEEGQDVYAALEEFYLDLFETEDADYTDACTTGSDDLEEGRTGVDIALTTDKNAIDNNMFVQVRGIDIRIVSLDLSDNNVNNNNNSNNNNNNNNTSSNHDAGIVGTGKITTVERDTGATCTLDCNNNNSDNDNDINNNNGKHDTGASDEIVSSCTLDCGKNNSDNDNDLNNNNGNHIKNVNIGGLSFTELLWPGLGEDEGDGRVNLSFGLSTGRSTTPSRTVLVRPHPDDEGRQLTVVDRSARMRALATETAGTNRNSSTPQPRAASLSKGAQGRPEWMQLPSPLSAASEVARGRGVRVDGGTEFLDVGNGRDGRENENETDDPPAEADDDDDDNDVECGEGGSGHASPSLQSDMAGKGGKSKPSGRNARPRAKKGQGKGSGGEGDGDAEEKRNFWSETVSRGFNFTMDRAVYDEIEGSTGMNHTIHPKNVADTGASGGVRPPSTSYVDPESVADGEGGAGQEDDEEGSTRGSSQMTGTPDGSGKRKSTRQQTFEALTECMEKHGELMASTMESASKRQCSIQVRQCEALEAEVEVQRKHYAASDEIVEGAAPTKKGRHQAKRQRKVVQAVPAGSARDVVEEVVVEEEMTNDDDDFEDDDDEPLQRKARVSSAGGVRINEGGEGTPTAWRGGGVASANQPVFVDVARDVARRDIGGRAKEGAASHETAQRVLAPLNRPRTPTADVAGSSQAAVEGGTFRSPAVAARGGAVAVPGEAVEVPKGGDGAAAGEDDEALVHRLREQHAATHAMDANRFWNDT
ncbi:hypothetical protein CBR_g32606 [Chara braunii]|uniref:Uncharacterized protein n=1 Tax=Chara braunii TaxID=69332 RepID=A0A388LH09_CHABU|nr:hypothetical protein CBR_g32606 [Chara braunii]|eukprot:GBG81614.1 hypothetical protein CBR_g32606 [Chara braunii]